jgi:DNA-binding transcriptional ArsR family regulator
MQSDQERTQEFFRAIGDLTRRSIMDLLVDHGPMTVTEIAERFPHLVRSGISKHLMELRKANIVHDEKRGRERYYTINSDTIRDLLHPWVAKYEKYWESKLQNLKNVAEKKPPTIK